MGRGNIVIVPQCERAVKYTAQEHGALEYLGISRDVLIMYAVNAWQTVTPYSNDAESTMMELMDNDAQDLFFENDNPDFNQTEIAIKQAVDIYNELKPVLDVGIGELAEETYVDVHDMSGTAIVLTIEQ